MKSRLTPQVNWLLIMVENRDPCSNIFQAFSHLESVLFSHLVIGLFPTWQFVSCPPGAYRYCTACWIEAGGSAALFLLSPLPFWNLQCLTCIAGCWYRPQDAKVWKHTGGGWVYANRTLDALYGLYCMYKIDICNFSNFLFHIQ